MKFIMDFELSGALEGLEIISISDRDRFKCAINRGEQNGFAYYFPNVLSYNRAGKSAVLLMEDEGSICVFRRIVRDSKPRLDILLAPSPMNVNVLHRCLERANDFNGNKSARVLKIDEKDVDILGSLPGLNVKQRKSQFLFAPATYADISSRPFRTMRRGIAKVRARDNLDVQSYSSIHTEACLDLLKKWRKNHRDRHGTMGGVGTTRRVLEMAGEFGEPDIHGEVIYIDNKLVGFAFGGEIRPGYAAFLEAKCDYEIQGLSLFQRYSFMSNLQQYELINDGPDVGRAGLAQLKNSLRPVGMHIEYQARQR